MEQVKKNYHAALTTLKDLDPLLKVLTRNKEEGHWFWIAVVAPIKALGRLVKRLNIAALLKAVSGISIPVAGVAGAGVISAENHLPVWATIVIVTVTGVGVYYLLMIPHINKMIIPGNPEFHLGLFKKKRREEYERYWERIMSLSDFNFEGLQDFVGSVFGVQTIELSRLIQRLEAEIAEKDLQNKSFEANLVEYEQEIKLFAQQQEKADAALAYVSEVIKELNITLYRFVNKRMSFSDLAFISGITIYRQKDDWLYKIADERTTGVSPNILDINDSVYENYSMIAAVRAEVDKPHWVNPYPGHYVVSNRMRMMEGEVWLLNFHFDEKRNEKALSLLLPSDMIEIREIYRMFHVLCLILQQNEAQERTEEGGAHHELA
ncbi:hypothetical protein [Cohnella phaseoli]|uniref:Uncharacterized protein n=1 Tax=Cohnella phaseoli TaxID=456490 RepID=A0A3D9JR86_9BACL|nr:hypothetical protein [Cohnella phaseoli]RED75956.1 hypothetical protein DFP98_11316 [Cohnella phaseoli]